MCGVCVCVSVNKVNDIEKGYHKGRMRGGGVRQMESGKEKEERNLTGS